MSSSDSDSSNGFDMEENFVDFDEADETTSIPPKDTTDTLVPVPEITEGNLTFVPSLAHPLFEEVGYDFKCSIKLLNALCQKCSPLRTRRLLDQ